MKYNGKLRKMSVTEGELRDLVVTQMLPHHETARRLVVAECTIYDWCKRFGIKRAMRQAPPPLAKMTITEEQLRGMAVDQRMSDVAIAKQLNVCSVTVLKWRQRFGIPNAYSSRGTSGPRAKVLPAFAQKFFVAKEELAALYSSGLTQENIAKKFGVSQLTVSNWMHRYGIEVRSRGAKRVSLNEEVLPTLQDHSRVHRYMEKVAAYLCGLTTIKPEPVSFGMPVFWGGRYITSLDLTERTTLEAQRVPSRDEELRTPKERIN